MRPFKKVASKRSDVLRAGKRSIQEWQRSPGAVRSAFQTASVHVDCSSPAVCLAFLVCIDCALPLINMQFRFILYTLFTSLL
jgi:hypothetical protein